MRTALLLIRSALASPVLRRALTRGVRLLLLLLLLLLSLCIVPDAARAVWWFLRVVPSRARATEFYWLGE